MSVGGLHSLLKGCRWYTLIGKMSSYLLIENPAASAPKTTAFASVDELSAWVNTISPPKTLSEVYKSTMYDCIEKQSETRPDMVEKLLKACKNDIERKATSIKRVEEALKNKKLYLQPDSPEPHILDSDISNEEFRKDFALFSQHPTFVHYYAKALLIDYYANYIDFPMNVHEYFEAFHMSSVPENKIFKQNPYFNIVKTFYTVFGRVLPELAYKYRFKYFDDVTKVYFRGNHPELPDMENVEEAWVHAFTNTYYEKVEGAYVQRSDFVKHFNEHVDELMNSFPSENKDYRTHYEKIGFPFASAPEKTIDLPTVRRSAGMFITGLRRKTPEPKPEQIVKMLREMYNMGPMCNDWKRIEPINPPKDTKTKHILSWGVVGFTSEHDYENGKVTFELDANHVNKLDRVSYGFTGFRFDKNLEMFDTLILKINDKEVDRIYSSSQPNGRFELLSGNNFIPITCKVVIEAWLNKRTVLQPWRNTKVIDCREVSVKYDIVELVGEKEEVYRDFWYTVTSCKGMKGDRDSDSQMELINDGGYKTFIDSIDIILSKHCNSITLTLDGTELPLQATLVTKEHMIEGKPYYHWLLDMTKLFGQDTLNFANINKAILKFNNIDMGYIPFIYAKCKNRIIFEKGGKMRLPYCE